MKPKIILILAALTLLSGCGIKPGDVTAPQGEANDRFPHTYPDPATDPQPRN